MTLWNCWFYGVHDLFNGLQTSLCERFWSFSTIYSFNPFWLF